MFSPNNHQEIPDCPYQGLMPYLEEQADFFFGREKWSAIITDNLMVSRLTILYGTSGVGKTSVLRAGVAHHLRQLAQKNLKESGQPEFAVVVFSAWRDEPVAGLVQKVEKDVKKILPAVEVPEPGTSLAKTLENWAKVLVTDPERSSGKLLIILDQFEEYFQYHSHEDGEGTFAFEFPRAINKSGLPVNFLISLREDTLAKLDHFKGRISNLFGNYLRIPHLDEESAVDAIRKPLGVFNQRLKAGEKSIGIETELVQEVLEQVKVGKVFFVESGKGGHDRPSTAIETSYLQLVMERLWKEEMKIGSDCLRLETFKRLGEAENILKQHLNERMEPLLREEKNIAAQVFEYLVTPGGTKITYPALELAEKGGVETQKLEELLRKLSSPEQRILRSVGPSSEKPNVERYEIFHDKLAPAILEWRKEYLHKQEELRKEYLHKQEELRKEYLHKRDIKRWQLITTGVASLAFIFVGLLILAEYQRSQAAISETKAILASSNAHLVSQEYFDSLIDGLRSFRNLKKAENSLTLRWFLDDKTEKELRQDIEKYLEIGLVRVNEKGRLSEEGNSFSKVSFSPNGSTFVTYSPDGTIKLWDLDGKKPQEWKVDKNTSESEFIGANFGRDGQILAAVSEKDTVKLRRLNEKSIENKDIKPLVDNERGVSHGNDFLAVSFSPNGEMIATARKNQAVKLWNGDGKLLTTLIDNSLTEKDCESFKQVSHCDEVLAVSFSPNGEMIATASKDQTVKLWNRDGKLLTTLIDNSLTEKDCETFKQVSHCDEVWDVSFSPNGEMIATASRDKTVKLWQRDDGKLIRTLRGHTDGVLSVSFNPKDQMLASAGYDKNILFWNTNDGSLIKTLSGNTDGVRHLSFSPNNNMLASVSLVGEIVKLWNISSNPIPSLTGHSDWVFDVSFSHDGQTIATASRDNTVKLWQRDGKLLQTLTEHKKAVWDVTFSPDDKILAAASQDKTVKLWEKQDGTWKLVQTLDKRVGGHESGVLAVTFSPKDQIMATASDDSNVKLWKKQNKKWEFVQTLYGHGGKVSAVTFSPDDKILATASNDQTVKLWEKQDGTWKLVQTLYGHKGEVLAVTFSPDGHTIATASHDRTAKLWKKRKQDGKWEVVQTLYSHEGEVLDVSFSPNGQILATASQDQTVKLWKKQNEKDEPWRWLATLNGHNGFVSAVNFSPRNSNGDSLLASASTDGTVILWNRELKLKDLELVELDKLADRSCDWVRSYWENNPNVKNDDKNRSRSDQYQSLCQDIESQK
jgi:WD40 repeat protein